jgi:hypothetical protein
MSVTIKREEGEARYIANAGSYNVIARPGGNLMIREMYNGLHNIRRDMVRDLAAALVAVLEATEKP